MVLMGILSWLGIEQAVALGANTPARGVVSPWAGPAELSKVVIADLFGLNTMPVTRAEAMSIPAVARARHLICTTLSRQPLRAYRDGVALAEQPTWLYRTNTMISPRLRTLWLLDDLFFYGWSLLAVERGSEGQIIDAVRVPKVRWSFDPEGRVLVDDKPVTAEQVVLVPGISEGFLAEAARTVRSSRQLEEQWANRVKNPVPVTELRYTGDENLTPEEMVDVRESYINARNDTNGVVMVTPSGWEVHPHGDQALDLFVEGRNAASVDVSRFANMPAAMLDASNVNESSLKYMNQQMGRSEFIDLTLRTWAMPLEERLSLDDVVPRGTYVAFDFSDLRVNPDTGQPQVLED